jgi:erythromycin esterase-like protein
MNLQTPETERTDAALLTGLRAHLQPLSAGAGRYDGLMGLIGPARFALLGEASHGTHEFYRERAEITKRLIVEKGFTAVAVEADWPDAWRVNRYVRGWSGDADANTALSGFQRFPAWMWRNTVVRDFVDWLRAHNRTVSSERQVGFYGLDLYSLFTSMQVVLGYLAKVDPAAAARAKSRYACFDHAAEDAQAYGYAAHFGLKGSCEADVVQVLSDMARRQALTMLAPGAGRDEAFAAQQNARLVRNAEAYYRTMFQARVSSWNLRDSHMVETLVALDEHLTGGGTPPHVAVWAHNSHLGDASATEMGQRGEWNVGQLVRQRWAAQAVLVGFSTHHGWVTAAANWDEPAERQRVRPGLPGSWEAVLHQTGTPQFLLPLRDDAALRAMAASPRLQRAIGVIYRPDTERQSHYFHTQLARQFDALVHIDGTTALQPLDAGQAWVNREAPETFPSGV